MHGSPPPRVRSLASGRVAAALLAAFTAHASAEELRPYEIVGDAIPASLTGAPGDPERGREIVGNRQVGLCLLCHTGAGTRASIGQLRLRIVDASRLTPNTIMPPYYRVDGLTRVAASYRGKPILSAEQIEDVVAFLSTLKD
jgi:sulfur-oxidizing protein SoxX